MQLKHITVVTGCGEKKIATNGNRLCLSIFEYKYKMRKVKKVERVYEYIESMKKHRL